MSDGLLNALGPADDELAFVLAHEITHIRLKHGVKNLLIGTGLSLLTGNSNSNSNLAAKVIGQLLISGRSRKDEGEADLHGVKLMTEAGYDPAGALAFMRRLETLKEKENELGISGALNRLFKTHPETETRSEFLKDYLIKSRTGFTWKNDIVQAVSAAGQSQIEQTPIGFYWPTGSSVPKLGPGFLATPPIYLNGKYHLGQDISVSVGSAVYAISEGSVHHISTGGWGGGNVALVISHQLTDGSSFYAVYGHIRNVSRGHVKAGQQIGVVGPYPEGGNHLHFGIYPGKVAPTAPLGLWALPKGWKTGAILDPKGFFDPIIWITTQSPWSEKFEVVSVIPQNNAHNISSNSDIEIHFNQPIDNATVDKAVKITGKSEITDVVGGAGFPTPTLRAHWSVDSSILRGKNWFCEPYTQYVVTIAPELRSTNGMSLDKKFTLRFSTGPASNKILIEKDPQHLGDDEADSKTIWLKEFFLSATDLANKTKAKISLLVQGTPHKDPIIYINRHEVGRAITHSGQWEKFEFSLDAGLLHEGRNLIDLETIIANLWQTFDDCEFTEVCLILE